MPRLRRLSDGKGHNGGIVKAISWNEDGSFKEVVAGHPVVGCSLMVESATAGMFTNQDHWLTTVVTEILEERKNEEGLYEYVKFKTENSVYEITT